jgi:hypothetical protein
MNMADSSIADYCGKCGAGLRVWKPGGGANHTASTQGRERSTISPRTASQVQGNVTDPAQPGDSYRAFDYRVVPFIGQSRGTLSSSEVTNQLQTAINQQAAEGWEFCQLSDVNIEVQPGCIAGLFGATVQYQRFDQLIFKMPK